MVFGLKEINQIFGSFFNRTFELNNCKLFCGGKTVQTHIFAVAELRVGWVALVILLSKSLDFGTEDFGFGLRSRQ